MSRFSEIAILLTIGLVFSCSANAAAAFSVNGNTSNNCSGLSTSGSVSCSFNGLNAGGSSVTDSLGVTNLTANSLLLQVGASTSNGGNWLSASVSPNPIGGNKTGTLSITVSPKSLPPLPNNGSYNGTVTVSGGGTTVTISISVTTSGVALALSPNTVALTLTVGSKANQTIRLVNPNNNSSLNGIGANIQSNQTWCSVSGFDGSSFKVTIDATSLNPGSAGAMVTVQYNGNGSPFVTVGLSVALTVAAPATPVASPGTLTFSAFQGRSNPAPQSISLTTSDGSTLGFNVTAMPSFASVSPASGMASGNATSLAVTVNTSALRVGPNSGVITLILINGGTTNITVNAALGQFSISANPNPPSPVTLTQGKSQVIPIQIGTADNAALPVSVTTQTNNGSGWLTAPASITAPQQVLVTVAAGSLTAGTYTGSVTFVCPSTNVCASVTVPVMLTVTTLATLNASPDSVNFQGAGGSLPASQTVNLTSSDQSPQQFSFTFAPTGSWLKVIANQTTTPATLTVSVISLPSQNSSGSITITPADGAPAVTIPVSFATAANQPAISTGGVIFAGSYGAFPVVTSGAFVEIYGSNLATTTTDWGASFVNSVAPTSLAGVSVQIDGKRAFIAFVSPGQVNALAPDNIAVGGTVQVVLTNSNGTSAPVAVKSATVQPGLLAPPTFKINGKQYVVAILPDGNFALPAGSMGNSRPAGPGEVLVMYGLGFGPVAPAIPVGTLVGQANMLQNPMQMFFGSVAAPLQYDGLAPNFAGLYQFNVQVPLMLPDNDAAPVTFNLGGVAGTQTLFIAVHQ